jgi:hypothetical protein
MDVDSAAGGAGEKGPPTGSVDPPREPNHQNAKAPMEPWLWQPRSGRPRAGARMPGWRLLNLLNLERFLVDLMIPSGRKAL